jgi:SAM-dependent methyltransferase
MSASTPVAEWSASAPYWERHADGLRKLYEPFSRALEDAVLPAHPQRLLDVASGPGEPGLSLAGRVPAVVVSDLAPAMVEGARRVAERRNVRGVAFCAADAASPPFRAGAFDALVCRHGAMFFSDPVAAISALGRIVVPGGPLAFLVFGAPEENPFLTIPAALLARRLGWNPPAAGAPGPFRFSKPGVFAGWVAQAGLLRVEERVVSCSVEALMAWDEWWLLRRETGGGLREGIAKLSETDRATFEAEVKTALAGCFVRGTARFAGEGILVTGRAPWIR